MIIATQNLTIILKGEVKKKRIWLLITFVDSVDFIFILAHLVL